MTHSELALLISSNYSAFLMLGGLFVMMYVYRDSQLPASRTFKLIGFILFVMCVSTCIEDWAILSPDRIPVRVAASVAHYILQPLVLYLELVVLLPRRMSGSLKALIALPVAANTVIYLIAPFAGHLVFWYGNNHRFIRGPLGYSVYIVTFIYLMLLIYWSVRRFRAGSRRIDAVLLLVAGIAIVTGLLEMLDLVSGFIDEAFTLGALLYYLYLVTLHESEMKAALASKDLELSKRQLALLRQQIRPHFVFNSLHIIKALIRTDRDAAVQGIENFSEYLRANIDVITSDTLIPFEKELSCTRAYVSLALADETRDICVDYDIKEKYFRIPALTVEPLVENAIRHGLTEGGKVTISTDRDGRGIVISVSDNGRGFGGVESGHSQAHTGTGINNVRTRLEALCGGTLEIKTGSGGTEAVIRIPDPGNGQPAGQRIKGTEE